jgi:mannose-6-phosphate isomerase-like protein (cupin superfamily)
MTRMSYPEPVYLGETGEASATFRPATQAPELSSPSGNRTHYLATGTSTGGKFGLYRWDMGAAPSGPGPHFHRTITESFFVLDGTVRIYDGRQWRDSRPGDFVHVPEGGVHGFRNESGRPASMLILFAPGAPREEYFETLADAARREAMDDAARDQFFTRHDNVWL